MAQCWQLLAMCSGHSLCMLSSDYLTLRHHNVRMRNNVDNETWYMDRDKDLRPDAQYHGESLVNIVLLVNNNKQPCAYIMDIRM